MREMNSSAWKYQLHHENPFHSLLTNFGKCEQWFWTLLCSLVSHWGQHTWHPMDEIGRHLEWPHSFLSGGAGLLSKWEMQTHHGAFTITEVASGVTHRLKMRNTSLRGVKCLDEMPEIPATAGSKPRSLSPRTWALKVAFVSGSLLTSLWIFSLGPKFSKDKMKVKHILQVFALNYLPYLYHSHEPGPANEKASHFQRSSL